MKPWPSHQIPPANARLFLGLWPTVASQQQVKQAAAQVQHTGCVPTQARALAPQDWHITLAFLGHSTAQQWHTLLKMLTAWSPKMTLACVPLDRVGYFPQAHTLWLGADPASAPYAQLQALHQQLWQQLDHAQSGFVQEDRPFVPHVSLWRRWPAYSTTLAIAPVDWCSAALRLVVSLPSAQHSEYYCAWSAAMQRPEK